MFSIAWTDCNGDTWNGNKRSVRRCQISPERPLDLDIRRKDTPSGGFGTSVALPGPTDTVSPPHGVDARSQLPYSALSANSVK